MGNPRRCYFEGLFFFVFIVSCFLFSWNIGELVRILGVNGSMAWCFSLSKALRLETVVVYGLEVGEKRVK